MNDQDRDFERRVSKHLGFVLRPYSATEEGFPRAGWVVVYDRDSMGKNLGVRWASPEQVMLWHLFLLLGGPNVAP